MTFLVDADRRSSRILHRPNLFRCLGAGDNPGAPAAGGSQVTGDPTEERVKRREKRENTSHSPPLWRRHRTEQLRFRIPAAAFAGQTHGEQFAVATRWPHSGPGRRRCAASAWRLSSISTYSLRQKSSTSIINRLVLLSSFFWCLLSPKISHQGSSFNFYPA